MFGYEVLFDVILHLFLDSVKNIEMKKIEFKFMLSQIVHFLRKVLMEAFNEKF